MPRFPSYRLHAVVLMTALWTGPAMGQSYVTPLTTETALDADADDHLGAATAMNGEWTIAGAPGDEEAALDAGSAYLFRRVLGDWQEFQKLVPAGLAAGDDFGRTVALHGSVALVGAPLDDSAAVDAGAAYVFRWNGASWTQEQKLVASDGATGDQFGAALTIHGQRIAISAPLADTVGADSGSVYVFEFDGSTWNEQTELGSSDQEAGDRFGESIALHDDRLVAGTPGHDGFSLGDMGAAYVFEFSGTTWSETQQLIASNPTTGHEFGASVAIEDDVLLVSSPFAPFAGYGTAYSFTYDGSSWQQVQQIVGPPYARSFGRSMDVEQGFLVLGSGSCCPGPGRGFFYELVDGRWVFLGEVSAALDINLGVAVAANEEGFVVGSFGDSQAAFEAGALLFYRHATDRCRFRPESVRTAPLMTDGYLDLGASVDLEGDVAIAGDSGGNPGQAVVYRQTSGTWNVEQILTDTSPHALDEEFGASVAVEGNLICVGFPGDVSTGGGAAVVFRHDGATWQEEQVLGSSAPQPSSQFGGAVDIAGGRIFVADIYGADGGDQPGSVHVFEHSTGGWTETQVLTPSYAGSWQEFGTSVSADGNRVAVGTPFDFENGAGAGAVYVFDHDGTHWNETQKVVASDVANFWFFGEAVSLDQDSLAVGATRADTLGAVYVYRLQTGTWTEQQKIPGDVAFGYFGSHVALDGDWLVIEQEMEDYQQQARTGFELQRFDGTQWNYSSDLISTVDGVGATLGIQPVAMEGRTILAGFKNSHFGINEPATGGALLWFVPEVTLDASPELVHAGESMTLTACAGVPGGTLIVAAVQANGISMFWRLTTATFDADERWSQSYVVPPGVEGLDVTWMCFGQGHSGSFEASNPETVRFR